MKPPLLLSVSYSAESSSRTPASFLIEIRDKNQNQLWSGAMSETNGTITSQTFVLPENIVDIPLEFRLYIITESIGRHSLTVPKANILYS